MKDEKRETRDERRETRDEGCPLSVVPASCGKQRYYWNFLKN
ncbi:hypothetical protein [Candidatus Kuenenia sp.]